MPSTSENGFIHELLYSWRFEWIVTINSVSRSNQNVQLGCIPMRTILPTLVTKVQKNKETKEK